MCDLVCGWSACSQWTLHLWLMTLVLNFVAQSLFNQSGHFHEFACFLAAGDLFYHVSGSGYLLNTCTQGPHHVKVI